MILWEAGKHEVKEVQNESVLIVIFRIGYYKTAARSKSHGTRSYFAFVLLVFRNFALNPNERAKRNAPQIASRYKRKGSTGEGGHNRILGGIL